MAHVKRPSRVERWLLAHAPPLRLDSARALYERMPRQRGGQLPLVDLPYDPRREEHWADAARVADYLAHAPPDAWRVLDVGPGDGWPALPLAAARPALAVIGVDPSPRRTRTCTDNAGRLALPNARFVTADAAALPFAAEAFDLATAASALEEAAAPEAIFTEIRRVLRPGGMLRASYQNWRLETPEIESVLLWDGVGAGDAPARFYTYVRRLQEPPLERRYTLELPADGEAARLHQRALEAAAAGRRAYGETLLMPELGIALLERLAPLALGSTVVELRRWTTAWLVEALRCAGFRDVRATAHPGELGRHVARALSTRGTIDAVAPHFDELTAAIGVAAGAQPGDAMVAAVR